MITEEGNTQRNRVSSPALPGRAPALASSSYDTTARLWALFGPIVAGHTSTVNSVAFSPDGHILATASGFPQPRAEPTPQQSTTSRYRHLPVVDRGTLTGLVSIGDVVKARIADMELETGLLRDLYIARG
jgi:WD40 repeat protein